MVSLIAILASFSVPYFLRESAAATTSRAAEGLAHSLRQVRFRAINLNRDVYFHPEPGSTRDFYTAYVNLGAPGDVPTGTDQEVAAARLEFPDEAGGWRGRALPDGVTFGLGDATSSPAGGAAVRAIDLPTEPVVFEGRGNVRWSPDDRRWSGVVFLAHERHSSAVRAVTLSRTGLVKVWHYREGAWQ